MENLTKNQELLTLTNEFENRIQSVNKIVSEMKEHKTFLSKVKNHSDDSNNASKLLKFLSRYADISISLHTLLNEIRDIEDDIFLLNHPNDYMTCKYDLPIHSKCCDEFEKTCNMFSITFDELKNNM